MTIHTPEFFDATPELNTIYRWARARYAAPWAVFGAVLLRVAASTGPHVQLPGLIGGRASLNLLAAFVSPSGGGKGISDKVARCAWPAEIIERPIGSGEGLAATFLPPKKDGQEQITRAIFSVPEVDTLAGLASRQGSILLAQLKSLAMGELLGQSNASDATTRIIPAHTYRACLSVGAQPGHTGVIFGDTTGGTPQRFLWFPTTDPDMPAERAADPDPLDTVLPRWQPGPDGVVEIVYGPEEIAQTVIGAHLARQRGEADALDGHALLTRCKVAAVLAILHKRSVVGELDWQLSETVMEVSDRTRQWLLEAARQAARAKVRERAISRAVFDEIVDQRHAETVRRRIVRLLSDRAMPRGELRRAMGKQHYREAFDAVFAHMEEVSQIVSVPGEKVLHYKLNPEFTGEPEFTPENPSSGGVNSRFTGELSATITDLDSRRSHESERPRQTARAWLAEHLAKLRAAGHTTAESFAVLEAGEAAGYSRQSVRVAASDSPEVTVIGRRGKVSVWDITGAATARHQGAATWVANYIERLARDGHTEVDKEKFRAAAQAAGYTWTAARHAATDSGRIESIPGHGSTTVWVIRPADVTETA